VESFNKRNKRASSNLPTLKAIIIDCSAINNVDITSVHALVDAREIIARHAAPNKVQWHFAHIYNRWTKRAFASVGFGHAMRQDPSYIEPNWRPMFNVTDLNGTMVDDLGTEKEVPLKKIDNVDIVIEKINEAGTELESGITALEDPEDQMPTGKSAEPQASHGNAERTTTDSSRPILGVNRPFFHVDVLSALQSVIHNIELSEDSLPDQAV
jgi:sodium-independent sulfate anion transporter 11